MTKHKDSELLQWIQSGDLAQRDQAFIILYRQYYPMVLKLVLQNKGGEEDAKDIFQDGLIVLYNQIQQGAFKERSTLKTYLYSICRNLWLKKLTRGQKTVEIIDNLEYEAINENALKNLIGTEREQCVEKLLLQLGEECNKILRYFYYDKLSMKKIKINLKLASEQVAKNKKMKCLKRLRKQVLESSYYLSLLKSK